MNQRTELYAWVLALATLIAIVVFVLTGHPVPSQMWAFEGVFVAGALALTSPAAATTVIPAPPALPAASVVSSDQAAPPIA
jgi:hypothetical protein